MSSNSTSIRVAERKKVRLEWVEYAKGIAIILVVYRHILIGVERSGLDVALWLKNANEVVYSFRMPLFFVLSGIFAARSIKKRSNIDFFKNKLSTIMYPYFIWGIIQISIQLILSKYTNADRSAIDFLYLLVHPRAIDQLWYLYALFNVSILFLLLYSILKLHDNLILFISIILFGLSTLVKEYSLIHDTCYYLIFFVIGHFASHYLLNKKNYRLYDSYKPFFFLFPFFWITQLYWLENRDMNLYIFGFIALLGTAFVFSISFILAKNSTLLFRPIQLAGRYSLQIYLMHLLVVSSVRMFLVNVVGIQEPIIILLIGWILGCILPIIIYNLLKKTVLKVLFEPKFK